VQIRNAQVGTGENLLAVAILPPLMSRDGRVALIVAALVVAVVAFVIASPGNDDEGGGQAAQMTAQAESGGDETTPAETETESEPAEPPEPEVTRIRVRGGEVVGGPAEITVKNGDVVRIVVAADAPDDIHLHGYDIEKPAAPGQPARFKVKADIEGSFEMESHVAEDAGRDPLIARLNVEPR
jgi:FtsP/CotA-like multicopper oxidase with cupredoxin domain